MNLINNRQAAVAKAMELRDPDDPSMILTEVNLRVIGSIQSGSQPKLQRYFGNVSSMGRTQQQIR